MDETTEIAEPYQDAVEAAANMADRVMGESAPTMGELLEIIKAFDGGLNQPMETAKKDGKHVLAWQPSQGIWRIACCKPGGNWLQGLTKWRPMPPAIKEDDAEAAEIGPGPC